MNGLILVVADLGRVRDIIRSQLDVSRAHDVSLEQFLAAVTAAVPTTEIASPKELGSLLRALAFKFGNLHSDHYYKIARRLDFVNHRCQFAPMLLSLLRSDSVWVLHADGSYTNENDHSARGWISLDVEHDDKISAGAGVGRRLNMWEFTTEDGLLWHPDGACLCDQIFSPFDC